MKNENVPKGLQHLMALVNQWGINDDGYRDEKIECSPTSDLRLFAESITEEDLKQINKYLSDEAEIEKSTIEYINYTCFLMASEYAKAVAKSQSIQKNY